MSKEPTLKEKEIERANFIRRIIYGLGYPQCGGEAYFEHIKEIEEKYN